MLEGKGTWRPVGRRGFIGLSGVDVIRVWNWGTSVKVRAAVAFVVFGILAALALVLPSRDVAARTAIESQPTYSETEAVGPGVRHTEMEWVDAEGPVRGDLLEVNLRNPNVSVDLLYPGVVAAAKPISAMADEADAVAGVNGDFFNIGETNAPVGPAIADGEYLKAAVPRGQRYGPGAPGLSTGDVFGVGADRVGRLDRLALRGAAITADGALRLDGLNQYAITVGGIGAFTPDWGTATRKRATCGTDTSRRAPCSENTAEVVVRDGVVTGVYEKPGSGEIPRNSFILVGREAGAEALTDELQVGERVSLDYELVPRGAGPLELAVGGAPILRDGQPLAGLNDTVLAPRTSAGVSTDGRRLYLFTVDGRSTESRGLTLRELAGLMQGFGADDAMNLDGGGSSTLVAREPGQEEVRVQNDPSDGVERPVPNGIGIFVAERGNEEMNTTVAPRDMLIAR